MWMRTRAKIEQALKASLSLFERTRKTTSTV